jgi:OOP family OmpA-OmpF porin
MKLGKALALLPLTLLLSATSAHAQWYAGASAGQARLPFRTSSLNDQFLDLGFASASTESDRRDTAYRLFGGWQINNYLALEAGYADLGRFSFRSSVTPAGNLDAKYKIKGAELAMVAMAPVWDRVNLFARGGLFRGNMDASFAGSGSVELLSGTDTRSRKSSKSVYAAGALFAIAPQVNLRAEWARYKRPDLGDGILEGKANIDMWTIGLAYQFN